MTWLLTATGITFDLEFIAPDAIDIRDIAHHLAQINRFTGACRRPYSVAEHSLLVCNIVGRGGASQQVQLAALMHDAHEAYTSDLSSPMKATVGSAWHVVEERVANAVRQRYGLNNAFAEAEDVITAADLTALVSERRALLPHGELWPVEQQYAPIDWYRFDAHAIHRWEYWRDKFEETFRALRWFVAAQAADAARMVTAGKVTP